MKATTKKRIGDLLKRARRCNESDLDHACRHGHLGCSYREDGPCFDETMSLIEFELRDALGISKRVACLAAEDLLAGLPLKEVEEQANDLRA